MKQFASIVLFLTTIYSSSLFANNLLDSLSDKIDIVVAQDGSGDFTSIQEALNSCKPFMTEEKVIFIKNGTYHEKVLVHAYLLHITLLGESKENTQIVYGDHNGLPGIGTFNSYTVKVLGNNITIANLTIENSSGEVGQAVALHVEGDKFYIEDCRLLGCQDTLYAAGYNSKQYYKNCYIDGTTDFIFGGATALFEDCQLHCKKNSYITAASTPQEVNYGFVFKNCTITANQNVEVVYLGRPWRDYAKVVFINCEMGNFIQPEGWHNWGQPEREKTAFYAEYKSKGEGARVDSRVSWSHQLTDKEVLEYTRANIFKTVDAWEFRKN